MDQEKEEPKLYINKDTSKDNEIFLEIPNDSSKINVFDTDGNLWTSLEVPKELNYELSSGNARLYGTIIHYISELKSENEELREEIQLIKDSLK